MAGAGALGGIGFTMSLFIARRAFPDAAAKIAIFIGSLIASVLGSAIHYPRRQAEMVLEGDETCVVRSAT